MLTLLTTTSHSYFIGQLLCALAGGKWVVSPEYLHASKSQLQEKKALRSILYTIVRIPPDRRRTMDAAVAWLVEGNLTSSGLLQSSGLRLLIEDHDDEGFFFFGRKQQATLKREQQQKLFRTS